jgi:hypothetical protein
MAIEWRFTQLGSVKSYACGWIAQQGPRVAGMVSAFPIDDLADALGPPHRRSALDEAATLT